MSKTKNAAFAASSKEYFPYAKTLRDSFIKHNPNSDFFFLLIDEVDDDFTKANPDCEVIQIKDIGLDDFNSQAFKYDVVEFNTSVKYSFIRYLQKQKGYEKVMYIDSDIAIYNNLDFIYDLLDKYSFVLTPHITKIFPEDGLKPTQQDITRSGTHNLGWVAVGSHKESEAYLDWAEGFCKNMAYSEPRNGLFTDQRQQDLAFTLFDNGYLLKDVGCNMAYWNLHERVLEKKGDKYFVNGSKIPLSFFHFSGLNVYSDIEIASYQNRYDLKKRADLSDIFKEYRKWLIDNGYKEHKAFKYSYDYYNNGEKITELARKLFAANLDTFNDDNPFDEKGKFYAWAKTSKLLDCRPEIRGQSTMTLDRKDPKFKIINFTLRMILRVAGANRYSALMKYFSYISVLRNQKEIFKL